MDQFTVPKFIEHEAKIVGPLTFRQFIYIGVAGAVCFVLYFTVPFFFFIVASVIIMLVGIALAFMKSGGRSLPIVLKNFLSFSLTPKMYLWKKRGILPPKIIEKQAESAEDEEVKVPTVAGKSRLNTLSTQVETQTKEQLE